MDEVRETGAKIVPRIIFELHPQTMKQLLSDEESIKVRTGLLYPTLYFKYHYVGCDRYFASYRTWARSGRAGGWNLEYYPTRYVQRCHSLDDSSSRRVTWEWKEAHFSYPAQKGSSSSRSNDPLYRWSFWTTGRCRRLFFTNATG